MTCGIYTLVFTDYDPVYVGQSANIEKRFKEHIYSLLRNDSNYKLQYAFANYNAPELFILEECNISDLNSKEIYWIQHLDTVTNGLNIFEGPVEILRGEKHPNSVYSNTQILEVAKLLVKQPLISYKDISTITGVSKAVIENIVSKKSHAWVWLNGEISYSQVVALKEARQRGSLTAGRLSKTYPTIISPDGIEHSNIPNLKEFSERFSLNHSHLCGVLNGKRKSHKGWRVKESVG